MEIPQQLWRLPTIEAIASLASRFRFPAAPNTQDPEVEFSDPDRIDEFLAAYEAGDLTDDERFLLMEILLNSFEFADRPPASQPQWPQVLELLDRNIGIHIYSVLSFGAPEEDWQIGPSLKGLVAKHGAAFGCPNAA